MLSFKMSLFSKIPIIVNIFPIFFAVSLRDLLCVFQACCKYRLEQIQNVLHTLINSKIETCIHNSSERPPISFLLAFNFKYFERRPYYLLYYALKINLSYCLTIFKLKPYKINVENNCHDVFFW